jgi:hypothetical protein
MSSVSFYIYDLISCDPGKYPTITNKTANSNNPHPLEGKMVYINQPFGSNGSVVPSEIYTLTSVGDNGAIFSSSIPLLAASNLTSCVDANVDKMWQVYNCNDTKDTRDVLFVVAPTFGDVVNFTGECTCWVVNVKLSTYIEPLTVATNYSLDGCAACLEAIAGSVCDYGERTLSFALKAQDIQPEPPDRGFKECCYSNLVLGDVGDPNNKYHNDFSTVYYQKQTPSDTVVFQLVGVSTGTTALVDVTHGVLYDFDPLHPNPDLSYFKVEWRKILSTLGEDVYTIRMQISIAGLPAQNVDSNSFILKPWSITNADNTARFDSVMDGTLEDSGVNFKGSEFETSLRLPGYFGNVVDDFTQQNVVFGSKKGLKLYESQITMSNDPSYTFQASNIPECISRQLRELLIFGNELFMSDYNLNNHSYRYELKPVVLDSAESPTYPVEGRGVSLSYQFKNRSKNNRKTNC